MILASACASAVHTPWMFPWERRQLRGAEDGKGLRTWEKLYWGVFVSAISVYLFSRLLLSNKKAEEDPVRCLVAIPVSSYSAGVANICDVFCFEAPPTSLASECVAEGPCCTGIMTEENNVQWNCSQKIW